MAVRSSMQAETVAIPKRLQLAVPLHSRDGNVTRDSRLTNCYVERDLTDNEYWIYKRVGHSAIAASITSGGTDIGRGVYKPEPIVGAAAFLAINNGVVSRLDAALGSVTVIGAVIPATDAFVFETIRAAPALAVFNSGSAGGSYYTNGVTVFPMNALANFPATVVAGLAYLNGTLYVMTPDSQIFGSAIDNPTAWTALNVIVARDATGTGVAIARHKEYVVALKSHSTEFFYDAANPTGSPLLPLRGTTINHGCIFGGHVQNSEEELLWVTENYDVIRLNNLQYRIVSTPGVERLLRLGFITSRCAYTLSISGHRFYCIPLNGYTLIYDLDENFWYIWTSASGINNLGVWEVCYQTALASGSMVVQRFDTGGLYLMGEDFLYTADDTAVPAVEIYTTNHDFGTQREKQLAAMFFRGDQVSGSTLKLRTSDDDFLSWSNFQELNLSTKRPAIADCGSFVKRAWHLQHQKPTTFRIKTFDLQLDLGTL